MTKPVLVLRNVKTTALTHSEHDQNFINLRDSTVSLTAGSGGTAVASDLNGNITLVAGTNVTITGDNTAKTITINAANESQNIFQNIAVAGQSTIVADSTSDTLTVVAGTGITLTTDAATDTLTITNSSLGGNSFGTVEVLDQGTVIADSAGDTVVFVGNQDASLIGDYVIRGIDLKPADGTANQIEFVIRNNTYVSGGSKSGPYAPEFDWKASPAGGAIHRVNVNNSPFNLQLPTGMLKGDRMRIVMVNLSTTATRTVDLVGTGGKNYRVARNRRQRYFEEDDQFPYQYPLLPNGGNMILDVMFDGVDYWTEINTDYEE